MRVPRQWLTPFTIEDRTLVLRFPKPRLAISSAVLGGGIGKIDVVINHQVDRDSQGSLRTTHQKRKNFEDPRRYLRRVMQQLTGRKTGMGMMTAVDLRHVLLKRVQCGSLWVEGFFTVGIANAVCAGEPSLKEPDARYGGRAGTINMILVTNASLPPSAMVGAIGVATESKTSVMLEHAVESWTGQKGATGTGTDALVFVAGSGPKLPYGGTHTKIGELIGRVVRVGIGEGLARIYRSKLEPRL